MLKPEGDLQHAASRSWKPADHPDGERPGGEAWHPSPHEEREGPALDHQAPGQGAESCWDVLFLACI